jgi:hypothetical protein
VRSIPLSLCPPQADKRMAIWDSELYIHEAKVMTLCSSPHPSTASKKLIEGLSGSSIFTLSDNGPKI